MTQGGNLAKKIKRERDVCVESAAEKGIPLFAGLDTLYVGSVQMTFQIIRLKSNFNIFFINSRTSSRIQLISNNCYNTGIFNFGLGV